MTYALDRTINVVCYYKYKTSSSSRFPFWELYYDLLIIVDYKEHYLSKHLYEIQALFP